jgi:Fe-S cluster biosynthesis and repair protein YggX
MSSVFCHKLQREEEALPAPPYPGKLGQRIYQNISKPAWQMWQQRQTMFINEYRLNLAEPEARKMLEQEMENFLFGNTDKVPEGYTPPDEQSS